MAGHLTWRWQDDVGVVLERWVDLPPMDGALQGAEAAGASFDNVMKCNVYCTAPRHFPGITAVYARYFPENPPARIFVCVPEWFGPFDIEIDCIAML